MGDLLKNAKKESQLINGMGITTGINAIFNMVYAIFVGWLTDRSGEYNTTIILSAGLLFLSGVLTAIVSVVSNKRKIV